MDIGQWTCQNTKEPHTLVVRTDWYGQEAGALAGGKNAPGMLRDKWPQSNPNYRVKKNNNNNKTKKGTQYSHAYPNSEVR